MNKTLLLLSLGLPLGSCLFACSAQGTKPINKNDKPKQPEKMNVIVFLVDDMGWQDCSLPFWYKKTPRNEWFRTPNMERLARKGEMFTEAYACSVSSPTRASLMSGMNAARHRVTNWIQWRDRAPGVENTDNVLRFPKWNVNGISDRKSTDRATYVTSIAQVLKDHGYFTIHCGKANYGAIGTDGSNPLNMGFDVNIAGSGDGAPGSYYAKDHYMNQNFRQIRLKKYWNSGLFLTEALTRAAIHVLDSISQKPKPFFLYMAHYAVHDPIQEDPRFYSHYDNKINPNSNSFNPIESRYATLIEGMDKSLGDIMDYLKKNNLDKNTIILFMSDNGGLAAHSRGGKPNTQNLPLNSGKGSAYEGGVREPMIVYWPGVTQAGSKTDIPVMIEDFYPSILSMVGIKHYSHVQHIDGKDFSPLLFAGNLNSEDLKNYQSRTGASKADIDSLASRAIYWHFPNLWGGHGPGIGTTSAIRLGDYKYIYYYKDGHSELFNIKNDIGEKHNLAKEKPELVKKLAKKLSDYLRSVNAQRPTFKATNKLAPWPDGKA